MINKSESSDLFENLAELSVSLLISKKAIIVEYVKVGKALKTILMWAQS